MTAVRDRLASLDTRVIDRLLAAGMTVAMVVTVLTATHRDGPIWANQVFVVAIGVALLFRRTRPMETALAIAALALGLEILLTAPQHFSTVVFALMFATYACGAHDEGRRSLVGLGAIVAVIFTVCVIETPSDIPFPVLVFGCLPWAAGRVLRNHTRLARDLAEKEALLSHEREEEERRAIAAERSRVAREIHDVLAHNLSVMVIQAAAARRAIGRDDDAVRGAAELIGGTGREALAELRHVFGTVRRSDSADDLGTTPGLARVSGLIDRAQAAGLPVELRVEGEARSLSPGADMAAYRVVQEALTNTLKHAGGARAKVTVRYEPADVRIEVADDGAGPGANPVDSGGHGLVGMRERVGLYGGELETGRRRGGGFVVSARMPLSEAGTRA
jgi:signal transduction histidine kinase